MLQDSLQNITPLIDLNTIWQPVGPAQIASGAFGNVTGRITGIAIDPSDATGNTVYVATTGGGVWKSVNAAGAAASVSFTPLTDALPVFNGTAATASLSIGAVSVQPGGTRVVLAGTGDPNDALDSYYGSGLLRSADDGLTWSLIQGSQDGVAGNHSFLGEGFAGFAWSTVSPNLVVAAVSQAAEGTIVNDETSGYSVRGLFYSTDAGATWQIATISDGSQVVQSAQSSFTSNGNAATAVVWNPIRQRFYAAVRFHGYYQSSDGMNWTRLANQPGTRLTTANCPTRPDDIGSTTCPIFRGALAVNPVTGDTFALTVDGSNLDQGLWQDVCALSGSNCASSTVAFARQLATTPLETSPTNTAIVHGSYNLTLAAIPTGSGATADTLLFAGTQDIFRCSLAAGCTWRNTTNADNGCATPAMVAPAQHAITALALPTGATQPLVYFGNDGGLWRSTDGVNEQGSACSTTDASHFQNLNSGLGSLAEIVHFSQSPADGNTFLAGVGALGTAATTAAATQSAWPQISAGEGGYNAIDATNPLNWYVSTGAGVSIDLCTHGGACTAADFAAQPVIGPAQTASDAALIDAPFLLDPALQSNLIAGTCRVWRGPGSGGSLWLASNLLSTMLDGVAEPECLTSSGAIRSLAAGGAVNTSSSAQHAGSEVIYAGLAGASDGGGSAKGGHIFATTAANTATSATPWTDLWRSPVTNDPANNTAPNIAQFNPGHFDISSIAVDAHDPTGATVYATVMGFSGNGISEPHVYRSIDGGAHWANISSNLPNAPANSVLIDPNSANTVYVALDTGVYVTTAVSSCTTPTVNCWSVYGTALPNAPVTQLAAVTGAAAGDVTGLLRAGTYGRGIWQIPLVTATAVQQPMPAIQLSPAALTFAAQQAQTASPAQSITVTNTGNAALTISQITATGDFTETDNCIAAGIAANTSCAVQVTFLPSTTGVRSGTLTIYANVTGGQATASLSGTGLAPAAITLNPLTLTFPGNTLLGSTSAAMNITVTNNGGVSTPLQTPVLTGDFAVTNNTCGTTLNAGNACGIAIAFTPTASGTRNGSFSITDSAGTQTATLSGTGAASATDTLAPSALVFAAQAIGTTSSGQQITITNTGDVALTLIRVSIISGDFAVVNNCGSSLIAHGSCAITVTYVPRSTGAATGTLSIADVNRTQTIALSGTGLAPAGVSLTPFAVSFGNVGLGHTSAPQTVTLTNNGGSPLTIGSIAGSGEFAVIGNSCSSTLAAGTACAITVAFTPTGTGPRTGMLTVTDNAATSPQTVLLTATGVDFAFTVGSSISQTVSANGGAAGYGLLLTPPGGISGTLAFTCTGVPANASCIVNPATADLSLASTQSITVTISTAVKHAVIPGLPGALWLALGLPLALWRRRRAFAPLLILFCITLSGCGVGRLIPPNSAATSTVSPTPTGTYTVTVTAADSVSLAQHAVQLTLIVQ